MTETTPAPAAAPSSPARFDKRPTTKFVFAGEEYTAKAPKGSVWMDVSDLIQVNEQVADARRQMKRAEESGMTLDPNAYMVLAQTVHKYPTERECNRIMVLGSLEPDAFGELELRGGWLRQCLDDEEAFKQIYRAANGKNSYDEDWWSLIEVAFTLYEAFHPWMAWRQESMGLKAPTPPPVRPDMSSEDAPVVPEQLGQSAGEGAASPTP